MPGEAHPAVGLALPPKIVGKFPLPIDLKPGFPLISIKIIQEICDVSGSLAQAVG